MPKVNSFKARTDIYKNGKRIKDPKTKSGYRIDRSQPADENDSIFCKKGETYYTWKFRRGGEHRSTKYPRRSQLTQSAYLSTVYDLQDRIGDLRSEVNDASDLQSAVDDLKSEIESLKETTEESLNNMPDQLQESDTGQLLQERIDALESAYSELDGLDLDYEEPDDSEFKDEAMDALSFESEEDEDYDQTKVDNKVEELKEEKLSEWLDEKCQEICDISLE